MEYRGLLVDWMAFWLTAIGTILGFVAIAYSEQSRQIALGFAAASNAEHKIARAIYAAYRMSAVIFGEKLVSIRSFALSCIVSFLAFGMSLLIAAATTPNFWHSISLIYETGRSPVGYSILIVLLAFTIEYACIVKSRLIIRLIHPDSAWYTILLLVICDIIAVVSIFVFCVPIVLSIVLDVRAVPIYGITIFVWPVFLWNEYCSLVIIMLDDLVREIDSGFSLWILTPFGFSGHKEVVAFYFPFTLMLSSSFATMIWIALCASMILLCRFLLHTFVAFRRMFHYLDKHPASVVIWILSPSLLVAFLGTALLSVLSMGSMVWPR